MSSDDISLFFLLVNPDDPPTCSLTLDLYLGKRRVIFFVSQEEALNLGVGKWKKVDYLQSVALTTATAFGKIFLVCLQTWLCNPAVPNSWY